MSIEIVQKKQIMSVLDQLKAVTTIVADTGDFEGTFNSIEIIPTFYFAVQFLVELPKTSR